MCVPRGRELELTKLQGRNLAAKDRSGTSDPVSARMVVVIDMHTP
jgi:hypothetical protein